MKWIPLADLVVPDVPDARVERSIRAIRKHGLTKSFWNLQVPRVAADGRVITNGWKVLLVKTFAARYPDEFLSYFPHHAVYCDCGGVTD